MLLPVVPNSPFRGEDRKEVRVQLRSGSGGQPAAARQDPFPFEVVPAVGSPVVVGREHREEVIAYREIIGRVFGEAAGASRSSHSVSFRW
jgi:hypothetical protein